MIQPELELSFPGLASGGYRVTSPVDPNYNCVAWAAGDSGRWWDPVSEGGYHWPALVPPVLSLPNLIAAFATLGFEPCTQSDLEPGFEKVAIYSDELARPTHVARQLFSGKWTSKLGASEDIEHGTLEALEGAIYGQVAQVLRRQNSPT